MDRLKDMPSPKEIKDALAQAPDSDLLNEVLRRGLIVEARQWPAPGPRDETMGDVTITDGTMKYWETLRERELQERLRRSQGRLETDDIDEAIASLMAGAARRHEYVGELFDLLMRKGRQARVMRVAIKILTSSNDDCPITESEASEEIICSHDLI